MKLDVLAFAAHPDDVEISAGGTIAKMVTAGKKVGIVDFTQGELGSRGSAELRMVESARSSKILGLSVRENLKLADGFFTHTEENLKRIVQMVRKYQPDVVLANSITDRHPDHAKGAKLASEGCFLSGLRKIETELDGAQQAHWRPRAVYHYIQDYFIEPDFVVDISDFYETKLESIKAFSSQFFDPNSSEPSTPISGEDFFEFIAARAMQFGRPIGAKYGEGFTSHRYIGVDDLTSLL
ncbi:MAG: bacillithiol biosynthesis deacetylase BshB1 [Flavobacteriales bacterium]|nr:bacillithiol biosynthesis deacetylase BshB1 [Flavobacteriales bacterium]MDG1781093.1 bacillithiol biosynthesis deacetylase BshB1 [Flavobacteriales bacterium]MDG2246532.1 bacillithiol biosynthesis deacetylase BshB1 [Flavobacteriales bacterium]